MSWCPGGEKLDQELFDAVTEFIGQLLKNGEKLAEQFGVPMFCVKAMHRLNPSMSMKELGKLMACDPSFVTMIADALEQRGLARREPSPTDRRIKNLVLTADGIELKGTIEQTLLRLMPWSTALDVSERECLLALVRKMTKPLADMSASVADSQDEGEVSLTANIASPAAL